MTDDQKTNLAIWDEVKRTDPRWTKEFDNGRFQGTATDPIHVYQRATELFGPCGIGWGWEELKDETITDNYEAVTTIHYLTIKLWYVWGGKRGEIVAYGGTTMASTTRKGARAVDEDAKKKSLTDALGKAFSFLGFTADVRLGMFDDVNYIENTREFFASKRRKEHASADTDPILQEAAADA